MKEKIIFYITLIGSFSAAIVFGINSVLAALEIDATGYTDIVNLVGIILSIIILLVSIIFFGKYTKIQRIETTKQNNLISTTLDDNANLMRTILPGLADQILKSAEQQATQFLTLTESKINQMVTEMLPTLAEQTMQIVTQKSQDLVEQTTAKATSVMTTMDELIPTYAKHISDQVAQTVRENNAHYHKMLTELKALMPTVSNKPVSIDMTPVKQQVDLINTTLVEFEQSLIVSVNNTIEKILTEIKPIEVVTEELTVTDPIEVVTEELTVTDPIEDITEPIKDITQNEDIEEKSNESKTA